MQPFIQLVLAKRRQYSTTEAGYPVVLGNWQGICTEPGHLSADKIASIASFATRLKLCFASEQGWFGAVIENLGDLDGDGERDVAVGAPRESEGTGAIYIYLSHKGELSSKPSQVTQHSPVIK